MRKFIEVTSTRPDERNVILNLDWVGSIEETEYAGCVIYMEFQEDKAISQEWYAVKESYQKVRSMLIEAGAL